MVRDEGEYEQFTQKKKKIKVPASSAAGKGLKTQEVCGVGGETRGGGGWGERTGREAERERTKCLSPHLGCMQLLLMYLLFLSSDPLLALPIHTSHRSSHSHFARRESVRGREGGGEGKKNAGSSHFKLAKGGGA